jgi:hypothetical protein
MAAGFPMQTIDGVDLKLNPLGSLLVASMQQASGSYFFAATRKVTLTTSSARVTCTMNNIQVVVTTTYLHGFHVATCAHAH